jgi:REP element-mobilizing transposase RayT
MTRLYRGDGKNVRHHVMNRGLARRTVFETRKDMRHFLALLAKEVKKGRIRVLCFCLMSTHFHLFVESLTGELAQSMRQIQLSYSRYFNRSRRRDGPLFRGRFKSKRVDTQEYCETLIQYIENNPVHGKMVRSTVDYEFCSAFHRQRKRMPKWLRDLENCPYEEELTAEQFEARSFVLEKRLAHRELDDDLDLLISRSPLSVRRWMVKKAELADGTKPGMPVCDPRTVLCTIADNKQSIVEFQKKHRRTKSLITILKSGLLRDLCGLGHREIAAWIERCESTTSSSCSRYHQLILVDSDFRNLALLVVTEAVANGPIATPKNQGSC